MIDETPVRELREKSSEKKNVCTERMRFAARELAEPDEARRTSRAYERTTTEKSAGFADPSCAPGMISAAVATPPRSLHSTTKRLHSFPPRDVKIPPLSRPWDYPLLGTRLQIVSIFGS
ncbi:unnamed protein product [Lasius platythorax]|uniref:Uncharacterized protein n=1 Tax=Lasius platythorax TaxID=488582 RepID=A0AAV2NPR8_9HYME